MGELIIHITYADALSKEEASDLIKKNEASARLSTEAFTKVHLVNMIPMRAYVDIHTGQTTNPLYSTSQIYSCLGTRRWVPAVSHPCQGLESLNSQRSLGECPQGYRELISFQFKLFLNTRRFLGFVVPA